MTELECIASRCGTDKSGHGYCTYYEQIIGYFKTLPCTLIELGVADGRSLKMWKEWMPIATVFGFDCNVELKVEGEIFTGDQSNVDDLEAMLKEVGNFHIVVDDASHQPKDQAISFGLLWSRLLSKGWYVIEDLDMEFVKVMESLRHVLGTNEVTQIHFFGEQSGSGILFLKKR